MTMGVNLSSHHKYVHSWWQVQQVVVSIYVDGAIRTAAAKVMPFTSQTHCEPKCTGGATFWEKAEHSRKSFSYAFRARPLQARPHILSPYFSGPILSWTSFLSFSGPPSARPIFHVPLFPGALCTGARRPGARVSGSPCCAALCVTRSLHDVANTRIMPRESGIRASRAMELCVQT